MCRVFVVIARSEQIAWRIKMKLTGSSRAQIPAQRTARRARTTHNRPLHKHYDTANCDTARYTKFNSDQIEIGNHVRTHWGGCTEPTILLYFFFSTFCRIVFSYFEFYCFGRLNRCSDGVRLVCVHAVHGTHNCLSFALMPLRFLYFSSTRYTNNIRCPISDGSNGLAMSEGKINCTHKTFGNVVLVARFYKYTHIHCRFDARTTYEHARNVKCCRPANVRAECATHSNFTSALFWQNASAIWSDIGCQYPTSTQRMEEKWAARARLAIGELLKHQTSLLWKRNKKIWKKLEKTHAAIIFN